MAFPVIRRNGICKKAGFPASFSCDLGFIFRSICGSLKALILGHRLRPKRQPKARHDDLFRARLDQIINPRHELVVLADKIDWAWLDAQLAERFSNQGRPAEPVRFMIGMFLLKHTYALSDEQLWDRWLQDPYFQYFTGEEFFQHALPPERSGMSHWRRRIDDRLHILLAESLRIAHDTGALKTRDPARVIVDTTVRPKNVTFPADAELLEIAIRQLGKLAKQHDVPLRQSYAGIATRAAITGLRRSEARFGERRQGRQGQGAQTLRVRRQGLAHHHPRTRARAARSSATPRPGNPYHGHTLKQVLAETQALTGREIERASLDKGYRGHDAPNPWRVFKSGQKRGVFGQIRHELRRRLAIEAVIGHCETDGHLGRNFLHGRLGDRINAVMSAVGYNLRLILRWFRELLPKIITAIWAAIIPFSTLKSAS